MASKSQYANFKFTRGSTETKAGTESDEDPFATDSNPDDDSDVDAGRLIIRYFTVPPSADLPSADLERKRPEPSQSPGHHHAPRRIKHVRKASSIEVIDLMDLNIRTRNRPSRSKVSGHNVEPRRSKRVRRASDSDVIDLESHEAKGDLELRVLPEADYSTCPYCPFHIGPDLDVLHSSLEMLKRITLLITECASRWRITGSRGLCSRLLHVS